MISAVTSPLIAFLAALAAAALQGASGVGQRLRDHLVVVAAAVQLVALLALVPRVVGGETLDWVAFAFIPEVAIAFHIDGLGLLFALTASALWLLSAIYAPAYLTAMHSSRQARFQALFALTIAATLGVALAANLLTLYLFYEVMTVATYFLVAHDDTETAHAGARRYLGYHLGTSILFLLPAIALTYGLVGSFGFAPGGVFGGIDLEAQRGLLLLVFVLFLLGNSKVALMPFHGWLPTAMVAPVPVSALLHAVAVVNAGAYASLRILLDLFGPETLQALGFDALAIVIAAITVVAASLYATRLDDLKALLAFSTIGQLAYMVLGAALATPDGATGAMLHLVNHGVAKYTLFLCAGTLLVATHRKSISQLRGVGRHMPWTIAAFAIAAFSMIGLPLTAGFISKLYLLAGAQTVGSVWAILALVLSTLLSAVYYLRALGVFLDRRWAADPAGAGESNRGLLWPLVIGALAVVVLGLFPEQTLLPLVRVVVEASFGN